MSWSIGGIIVAAVTYGFNKRDDQWAWRVPLALQWIFPVSTLSHILCVQELTRLDPFTDTCFPVTGISLVAYAPRT